MKIMNFQHKKIVALVAFVIATTNAMPYRSYQPDVGSARGTHPIPSGVDNYIASYLQAAQAAEQQQLFNRQNQYHQRQQPVYQQGYLQEQQPLTYADAVAAILPYINTEESKYPNYDYNNYNTNNYNNDDGIWYDDVATSQDIVNDKRTNDQLALAQLYIDSLIGKYSLEDLEALVQEAMYEDNTESQLHQLLPKKINTKKSIVPVLGTRTAENRFSQKKGQKEEALMVPATSVRRPVFAHEVDAPEEKKQAPFIWDQETSNTGTDSNNDQDTKESNKSQDNSSEDESNDQDRSASTSTSDSDEDKSEQEDSDSMEISTMRPYMKSAYEALKGYLDKERHLRQLQDEAPMQKSHNMVAPKRENLTQQLSSLKKRNNN